MKIYGIQRHTTQVQLTEVNCCSDYEVRGVGQNMDFREIF